MSTKKERGNEIGFRVYTEEDMLRITGAGRKSWLPATAESLRSVGIEIIEEERRKEAEGSEWSPTAILAGSQLITASGLYEIAVSLLGGR